MVARMIKYVKNLGDCIVNRPSVPACAQLKPVIHDKTVALREVLIVVMWYGTSG